MEKESIAEKPANLTIVAPAGRLPNDILRSIVNIASQYDLEVYFTTMQNVRLLGIQKDDLEEIKERLIRLGAIIKVPGMFPMPRVCVGGLGCNLALVDTAALSERIMDKFGSRTNVKPKYKIAISACPASCGGAISTDIGIVATRSGYDIYVGGRGGMKPQGGRRIVRKADDEIVLEVIEKLADFHAAKTKKKQRMSRLLNDPEFPYPDAA